MSGWVQMLERVMEHRTAGKCRKERSWKSKFSYIYFSSSFSLLKSCSFILFNFFCLLTSTLSFPSNFATVFFTFAKSSSLSHVLFSATNPFHYTKYLNTPCTFLLFNIFSTSYFSTSSTFISFTFSIFCPSTCSLYYTTVRHSSHWEWKSMKWTWSCVDLSYASPPIRKLHSHSDITSQLYKPTLLTTHLTAVMPLSRYSIFYNRDTPI